MRRTVIGLSLFVSCLLSAVQATAAPGIASDSLDAIWRVQQIDLRLRTGDRYHSCSALHSKIAAILGAVGAEKVVVSVSCNMNSLTNNVLARVATATPVEATAANVQAATTFDARAELVARLRQETLPTANDIQVFPAEWRTVAITTVRGVHLGPGDCDLLQGLTDQVFPRLSVRVVRQRLSCGAGIGAAARPILVVEALMRGQA